MSDTSPDPVPRAAAPRRAGRNPRRRSREFALQGLYQWLLSAADPGAIEAHLHDAPDFDKADREHFSGLLHGTIREADALRAAIAPHLDRPLAQVSPVEHVSLLLGAYEFAHHPEIPYRVVINEAVELAKTFGGTDGHRFVNGVLDRVAASLRPTEAAARR